ncbi:hypothetical protein ES708_30260 [subsurface metagenome]
MIHITRISSLVPISKGSKDYLMTTIFSNGDVKVIVLTAAAHADLVKHLRVKKDPSSQAQPKKKPSDKKHQ